MAMTTGELTDTWDYSLLPANVRLGADCFLEDRCSFGRFRSRQDPGLVLGDRVRVHNWTAFTIEAGGAVTVGDDSTLVGAIFWCSDRVTIGKRVVISYNVMIADSDFHPRDPDLRRQDAIAISPGGDPSRRPPIVSRPVVIEDDVWVGINAIILKGVRVGAGARVAAGAVVTADVPAGMTVAGNPARVVGRAEGEP
jgi:acetyltransferase-like isoleucine patch superfamily enzyme